jgi:hypothetical protein
MRMSFIGSPPPGDTSYDATVVHASSGGWTLTIEFGKLDGHYLTPGLSTSLFLEINVAALGGRAFSE